MPGGKKNWCKKSIDYADHCVGIHPPLAVQQQWTTASNPLHPLETRNWGLVVLALVLFTITIITVCARLWARCMLQHNAGLDDAVIVAATVVVAGLTISECLASRLYGFNRHTWDLSPDMAVNSRKITMIIEAFYIVSTGLTKVSILLFYKRLSAGVISSLFHQTVRLCIAFVILYIVTFLCTLFLGCRPIDSFWSQVDSRWILKHEEGVDFNCFNEASNLLAASAISIVQDFIACGMPALLFWKLQMPRRQKIVLGAIFGIGFFLCITGILRMYYIYNIFFQTYDVSWASEPVWAWTAVEAHVAIICASAPALKVFFKQYLNVSSTPSSLHNSRRQRGYFKNSYADDKDSFEFGTNTSITKSGDCAASDDMQKQIRLGHIAVTQVVDIDSESLPEGSNYSSEKDFIRSSAGPIHESDAPWSHNFRSSFSNHAR